MTAPTIFSWALFAVWIAGTYSPEAAASLPIPGPPQQRPIALVGATVHPVSGPSLSPATLVFDEGKITAIGRNISIPDNAQRIELDGKHIYPSLIESLSNIGLVEISAVRATRDFQETGTFNSNVQAQVAVNPDSELIPVTRSNGILLALTAPSGGLISGRSAVLQLDGWTWEEMTLEPDVAMHIQWPRMAPVSDWWVEQPAREQMEERDEQLRQLDDYFQDAQSYAVARAGDGRRHPVDARFEAMQPVLEGRLPVIISADDVQQIQAAVAFARRYQLRLILSGGYDAEQVAELLKEHQVPVIIGGVHRLPLRRHAPYDEPYTLPQRLRDAGIQYCISGAGDRGASRARNLAYHAATAAAYGLPPEEALKSVTLYPAQILGIADRVGSLEVGKDATLIVTDGDPLETATQVEAAYIQGREVQLSDRHKRLYERYQEKYRRLEQNQLP